ncbi:MAG: hypothetical protein SGBAC_009343 [Bacillariaceae sp.]
MEDAAAESNSNRSNDDDDQTMQPPSAMLSLLDKYSRMEAQLTNVRQEITRIQLEIRTRNDNVEKLLEERQATIVEQKRISKESLILQKDAKHARQQLESIQQETLQTKQKREEAQRNLDRLELQSKEYRQRFFQSSHSFRNECKKRKIVCQSLGLTNAPLVAHAMIFRPQMLSSFGNISGQVEPRGQNQDEEHNRRMQHLKALEASHEHSKQRRDKLRKQRDNLLDRSRDRRQRKSNLQAQLDRILRDIDILNDRRIQTERRSTIPIQREETSPMQARMVSKANSTSVQMISEKNTGVGGASNKAFHNPYAKSNRKKSQPSLSSTTAAVNSQETFGTKSTGATTEQYPHRVGRRRAPRDFGLSLRIEDGTDSDGDTDDDLLSFVAFRK